MARTLDREPTFQTCKGSTEPPAGAVRPNPFIRPTDQPSTENLHPLQCICPEPTPLLPSISLPANHVLTCLRPTSLQLQLMVLTLLSLRKVQPAWYHLDPSGRTVFPVRNRKLKMNCLSGPLLIFM